MIEKGKNPFPLIHKLKWGYPIFTLLLSEGEMNKNKIKKLLPKDRKSGKKITDKVLWETLKIMEKEKIIKKTPTIERLPCYDLNEGFQTREFNQMIYLNNLKKSDGFSDILNFQHTIYGLHDFNDLAEDDQKNLLNNIQKIDNSVKNIQEINQRYKNNSEDNIALISTGIIHLSKVVKENIDLMVNRAIDESLFIKIKYDDILSFGNIRRYADVIQYSLLCQNGKWIKDKLSKMKFLNHKLLKMIFKEKEINFMFSIIKEILNNKSKNINFTNRVEFEQFIIYNGFKKPNESNIMGLWYEKYDNQFYRIAERVIGSINPYELAGLGRLDRLRKIETLIPDDLPNDIKDSHLILYIEAKIYFEKIKNIIDAKHSRSLNFLENISKIQTRKYKFS
jgi:hypothetical protein